MTLTPEAIKTIIKDNPDVKKILANWEIKPEDLTPMFNRVIEDMEKIENRVLPNEDLFSILKSYTTSSMEITADGIQSTLTFLSEFFFKIIKPQSVLFGNPTTGDFPLSRSASNAADFEKGAELAKIQWPELVKVTEEATKQRWWQKVGAPVVFIYRLTTSPITRSALRFGGNVVMAPFWLFFSKEPIYTKLEAALKAIGKQVVERRLELTDKKNVAILVFSVVVAVFIVWKTTKIVSGFMEKNDQIISTLVLDVNLVIFSFNIPLSGKALGRALQFIYFTQLNNIINYTLTVTVAIALRAGGVN